MKKVNVSIMLLIIGLMFAPAQLNAKEIDTKAATDVVNIPDDNLKACINKKLMQPSNSDITISQMEGLTNISCPSGYMIKDINGLETAKNLTRLDMGYNQISDISSLSGLTNLTYITLDGNQISDISALSSLKNLEHLNLDRNEISDISSLSGLTNLKYLYMQENEISDISSLSGLTNLKDLYLARNEISDISSLSGLINLTYVTLDENQISDISSLSGAFFIHLNYLHIEKNQISDFSPLSAIAGLVFVYPEDQNINVDLGTFGSKKDIPAVYTTTIIESNGTKHDVNIDINSVTEGENNFTQSYDFSSKYLRYNGSINVKFNYIPNKPVINGVGDIIVKSLEEFDPMSGVSATDKEDGDLTNKIKVTGPKRSGNIYVYTYSVKDSDGNETIVHRNVTLSDDSTDPTKPGGETESKPGGETESKPGGETESKSGAEENKQLAVTGKTTSLLSVLVLSTLIILKAVYMKLSNNN